ncbi:hypothetical protein SLA2020_129680 [Shorea laevis]
MAPAGLDPFTDYSKTQRIVLLLDLNPVIHLQDPNPYLSAILSSSKTLLSFPPFSSSLFSFKPFFSSLSPLLSSSKLPSSSISLSFDYPDATLQSLTQFLTSLPVTIKKSSFSLNPSRASNLAASMRQILHDYAWDPVIPHSGSGTLLNCDASGCIRSNLVVLFSPFCKDLNYLRDFLDVEISDECLRNMGAFRDRFFGVFQSLIDAYVSRDIHCSWVDVKCELRRREGSELEFGFFESGIESLGWGFCSTDLIILGSSLVPFGLIYPKIGVSSDCFSFSDKTTRAYLSLEILDVSGKPLECKCSELEFVDFMMCPQNGQDGFWFMPELVNSQNRGNERQKRSFMEQVSNGVTKIHVKEVRRCDDVDKAEENLSDPIIVRQSVGDSATVPKENSTEFYADRFLQMWATEMGEAMLRKSIPIWQIFLTFLQREGYLALVSLSNGKGDLRRGILKPYTISSAFLSIIDDCSHGKEKGSGGVHLNPFISRYNMSSEPVVFKHFSGIMSSKSHPSASDKFAITSAEQGKKRKKNLHLLQNLTWSAFCQAASDCLDIGLEEAYFARGCNISKKLKFLKCWMKQVKKHNACSLKVAECSMLKQDVEQELNHGIDELPQESEQPISNSASVGEVSSRILDETANDFCSGSFENFFVSLPYKIQQGLESKDLDLGAIAERLVNSSIYWLYQKHEMENTMVIQNHLVKSNDGCASKVAVELVGLLLKEPKDFAAMHKKRSPSCQASDLGSGGSASVDIVREYELQILFRMEILQSEIRRSIEEPLKQKFVKQICLLLESIQCHLEGGFFGDWRLDDYVGKIIKCRYYHTLPDVVDRIYTKMDLLLFADDEIPSCSFNSEDSNQSQREKQGKIKIDENFRIREPVLAKGESVQLQKHDKRSPQEEHASQLLEVKKRRERARRFSYFTSSMPDLQRVWAPKQPKAMKPKSDPSKRLSKRKDSEEESYDSVCETPMTGRKRSCPHGKGIDDEDCQDSGTLAYGYVPKVLFQDDL